MVTLDGTRGGTRSTAGPALRWVDGARLGVLVVVILVTSNLGWSGTPESYASTVVANVGHESSGGTRTPVLDTAQVAGAPADFTWTSPADGRPLLSEYPNRDGSLLLCSEGMVSRIYSDGTILPTFELQGADCNYSAELMDGSILMTATEQSGAILARVRPNGTVAWRSLATITSATLTPDETVVIAQTCAVWNCGTGTWSELDAYTGEVVWTRTQDGIPTNNHPIRVTDDLIITQRL